MPEAPHVNPFTQHVFDNSWLIVILLVLCGLVAVVAWMRAKRRWAGIVAAALLLLAVAAWLIERLVVTSGEETAEVTRALVAHAEQADVPGTMAYFASDATLSLGDPRNPGFGLDEIRGLVEDVDGRYRVRENAITMLDSYSVAKNEAVIHLRCRSQLEFQPGIGVPVSTGWVIRYQRDAGGTWKVEQITFVDYDGQTPAENLIE